ncbi:hypothetical protein GCM10009639_61090 [Kitasatospora putterlickiae]|uniref:Uncharacterized protein n=1 Tax=Kitasatospora putterlickiae TaxID=221725 RepID=A0ABN1YFK5_9ACTN
MPSRSPGRARAAQALAGPVSPCSTKSISSSAVPGRRRRRVRLRIHGRSASGMARYAWYQPMASSVAPGSTGASWPGRGKQSLTCWSGEVPTLASRSSAWKVTRAVRGVTRVTSVTWT